MMPNISANTSVAAKHQPLTRAQDRRRARAQRALEEVGVERPGVVAEQLGRAKLQNERQLRAVVNVRQLERRAAAPRKNANRAGARWPLPPGLGQADATRCRPAQAHGQYGSCASRRDENP